ncbi:MAG: hypothetical protein KC931_21890, partial [Candidatus Omnitrophica bacterium]|nr:hypothetical protein [Candidatus Omnitrophota bacterium]
TFSCDTLRIRMNRRNQIFWLCLSTLVLGIFGCPHHNTFLSAPCWATDGEVVDQGHCHHHHEEEGVCDCLCCEDFVGHPSFDANNWISSPSSETLVLYDSIQQLLPVGVADASHLREEVDSSSIHQGTRLPNLSSLVL